jgi:hypothetical protein
MNKTKQKRNKTKQINSRKRLMFLSLCYNFFMENLVETYFFLKTVVSFFPGKQKKTCEPDRKTG